MNEFDVLQTAWKLIKNNQNVVFLPASDSQWGSLLHSISELGSCTADAATKTLAMYVAAGLLEYFRDKEHNSRMAENT